MTDARPHAQVVISNRQQLFWQGRSRYSGPVLTAQPREGSRGSEFECGRSTGAVECETLRREGRFAGDGP